MIQKVRTGEELLHLWRRALRFARKRTKDRGIAEEFASEAILRLLDHPPEELLDEWTFVCRQVVQLSERSRVQYRRVRQFPEDDNEQGLHDADAPSSLLEGLLVAEFQRIVREEAERLPEPDRVVVVAHLFEEMTFLGKACERHARLSTALGSTVDRTRHQLSRGLIRLRARLEQRLRRAEFDGAQGSLLILVPLLPRILSRQSLAPAWRRPSLLKSALPPIGAGLGFLLIGATGLVIASRGTVPSAGDLIPAEQVASHAAAPSPSLPPTTAVAPELERPSVVVMAPPTLATRRSRRPIIGFREDFDGPPVQVITPKCGERRILPLGDTEWRVQNLRTESCVPTENVNVVAIQADGLRIAADTNDEHGGYVGVQHRMPLRPLEWELTVRVTVAHVEDPYHRPVPQCWTRYGPGADFGDDTLGWCTTRDGERVQVLALRSPGATTPTEYIVEPGVEHTIVLTSLRHGAELRAWRTATGARPAAPLAVGSSLGELRCVLFTGPNWKTFDYRVHGIAMRMLGGASYGGSVRSSAGRGARLAAWVEAAASPGSRQVELVASGLPPSAFGRFVAGTSADRVPFGRGTLLVGGVCRALGTVRADRSGRAVLSLDQGASAELWALGSELFVQFLFADPGLGGARNATQGVRLIHTLWAK